MADSKITALTALTAADPANDMLPIVDVSDNLITATGTTKRISINNILACSPSATLASATITGAATVGTTLGVTGVSTLASAVVTGALTVDTATLVVDPTNDRVGIGTTTPACKLEVVAPAGDNIVSTFRSGDATAANNAGGGFQSISSATAASRVARVWLDADGADLSGGDYFFIQKNGNSGTVEFNQSSNAAMTFLTNGTERARFNNTGAFVLAGGTTTANGIGVAFPATQSASSDANCLDDYEEGTFTPTVTSVGGTGIVYAAGGSDAGKYTKIGNLVLFTVNLSGTYTGTFSYIRIALPFTVGTTTDAVSGYDNGTGLGLAGRTDVASARFIVSNPQSSGSLGIYSGSFNA